jgi:hypothetical protein
MLTVLLFKSMYGYRGKVKTKHDITWFARKTNVESSLRIGRFKMIVAKYGNYVRKFMWQLCG